jgi:hypothetical protein
LLSCYLYCTQLSAEWHSNAGILKSSKRNPKPGRENLTMPDRLEDNANNASHAEPSGPRGDNPATAGPGNTGIRSATPENSGGKINPSAPGDTGTTPGTNAQ